MGRSGSGQITLSKTDGFVGQSYDRKYHFLDGRDVYPALPGRGFVSKAILTSILEQPPFLYQKSRRSVPNPILLWLKQDTNYSWHKILHNTSLTWTTGFFDLNRCPEFHFNHAESCLDVRPLMIVLQKRTLVKTVIMPQSDSIIIKLFTTLTTFGITFEGMYGVAFNAWNCMKITTAEYALSADISLIWKFWAVAFTIAEVGRISSFIGLTSTLVTTWVLTPHIKCAFTHFAHAHLTHLWSNIGCRS